MPKPKSLDLSKHTLNLREGDFDKMGELFPDLGPSVAVRTLITKFVDKHYKTADLPTDLIPNSL